jgi:hypothetical protein
MHGTRSLGLASTIVLFAARLLIDPYLAMPMHWKWAAWFTSFPVAVLLALWTRSFGAEWPSGSSCCSPSRRFTQRSFCVGSIGN